MHTHHDEGTQTEHRAHRETREPGVGHAVLAGGKGGGLDTPPSRWQHPFGGEHGAGGAFGDGDGRIRRRLSLDRRPEVLLLRVGELREGGVRGSGWSGWSG